MMAVKLKLDHAGREYYHFPVSSLPADLSGGMEVLFPPATSWVAADWVVSSNPGDPANGVWSVWDGVTGLPTHVRILVAGPDAGGSGGTVLAAGSTTIPKFQLVSDPQIFIRPSPASIVVSSA
jgi:hypothetical protein